MSYAVPPPPKTRPSAVTTASTLLFVVVATNIISLIIALLPNDELSAALDEFNRNHPDFQQSETITLIAGIVGISVTTLLAVGLGVLAFFLRRGSQGARITTWVLGGLCVLCSVCGLAGTAIGSSMSGNGNNPDVEELTRIIEENTPAWQTTLSVALTLVNLVTLIAVIVLLALPASNDYFRKQQEVWVPPTDYPGGGGYGQTPPMSPPPGPPPAPPQP
jgi:MFS family permease